MRWAYSLPWVENKFTHCDATSSFCLFICTNGYYNNSRAVFRHYCITYNEMKSRLIFIQSNCRLNCNIEHESEYCHLKSSYFKSSYTILRYSMLTSSFYILSWSYHFLLNRIEYFIHCQTYFKIWRLHMASHFIVCYTVIAKDRKLLDCA